MRTTDRKSAAGPQFRGSLVLAVMALLAPLAPRAAAQTPTPLPPLSGDAESVAYAINDAGEVVGSSGFPQRAVIWNSSGTPTALLPLQGGVRSIARGINAHGQVAGLSISDTNEATAVVWDAPDMPSPLPPLLGDSQSQAVAINDNGIVAGLSLDPGIFAAVRWNPAGAPMPLPPLPGDTQSGALAINAEGKVAGFSYEVSTTAVVWDSAGMPSALPPPPGYMQSQAFAINVGGEVAGVSFNSGGPLMIFFPFAAVVWDAAGTPFPLPPLPGDTASQALAINAEGEVAGVSFDPSGIPTAVVWDATGTPTPLPPLPGDTGSLASAINANGDVAGSSGSTAVVWRGDSDGDGISDANDACPNSDLSPTVVVDGCDSGVENALDGDGCTISDLIAEVAAGASNHGGFVSGVAHLLNDLKKDGVISGRDQGAIQRCAAKADLP